MAYTAMKAIQDSEEQTGMSKAKAKEASKAQKLKNDPGFQAIMTELETQKARGFALHPKMAMMRDIILEHFSQCAANGEAGGTRVMVFVTFREAVDEIVDVLNVETGIKAHRFIGQGTDKQGKKGLAQKQQLAARSSYPHAVSLAD